MATYQELFDLRSNDALRNKVAVACVKKAQALLALTPPTADQVAWASSTLTSPVAQANKIYEYVLAANSAATVSAITNATDAAIQANVDAAADALITGGITS
jgi:hypothetical protein